MGERWNGKYWKIDVKNDLALIRNGWKAEEGFLPITILSIHQTFNSLSKVVVWHKDEFFITHIVSFVKGEVLKSLYVKQPDSRKMCIILMFLYTRLKLTYLKKTSTLSQILLTKFLSQFVISHLISFSKCTYVVLSESWQYCDNQCLS